MVTRKNIFIIAFIWLLCPSCLSCRQNKSLSLPPASHFLQQSEAQEICGLPVTSYKETDSQSGRGGMYLAQNDTIHYSVYINLQYPELTSVTEHDASHRAGAAKYGVVEDLDKIGDHAFIRTIKNNTYNVPAENYMIYVRKENVAFQIYAESALGQEQVRQKLIAQAQIVVSRLVR